MNMNLPKSDQTPKGVDPVQKETAKQPSPSATLSQEDVVLLQNTLGSGLSGYARKGDIVELHKRIGEKFEKLPGEISELSVSQREDMITRINAMETSLNSLEAALRIELPPLLTQTIGDAVRDTMPKSRSNLARIFWMVVLVSAGLGLGAWFHQPLLDLGERFLTYLRY
ncbi:hypothetical protein [Sedimentitalea todarodis]|uniref:Uncharacterized protein n=1 Tax=Sedimentitalea todarodis TaxID=1631240 RepID=A0ABU3VLT6_9RHOB|nr:hypothetical protein [Sedimentitalea todarodis]MDU9007125.1 hypothetical protein [Sedimentitalea todarodis]